MAAWRRPRWVVGIACAIAVTVGAGFLAKRPTNSTPAKVRSSASVLTATVERTTLTSRNSVTGTLGYQGSHTVAAATGGVLTAAPPVGSVITRGHPLFSVNNTTSYLLYGPIPAWRDYTTWSTHGPDIGELSNNLVAMGYLPASGRDDHAGWGITNAVEHWQAHLGLPVTGELTFGQIVFAPGPLRVTALSAEVGTAVTAGSGLLTSTSTTLGVTAALDPATATSLRVGNEVVVTTPDGRRRQATIASIASVASSTPALPGGAPTVTVPIAIRFTPTWTPPQSAVDQAPVAIAITVRRVTDALAVPVTALLAAAGGGYAVELDTGTPRRVVPVTPGLFDDISGLVQVSGALHEGQTVLVAAS